MKLDFHSVFSRRKKQASGLFNVKNTFFTKNIAEFGKSSICHFRKHFLYDEVHIIAGSAFKLFRNSMSSHKSVYNIHGLFFVKCFHGLKLLDLRIPVQAVTALSLHGGHTEGQHGGETLPPLSFQLFQSGFPCGNCSCVDAASSPHDVHIAYAGKPP
jgi:hypothetical protein